MKKEIVLLSLLILSAGCITAEKSEATSYQKAETVNDEEYFPTAKKMIPSANSSIKLLMFQARKYDEYPDSESNQLLEKIIEKEKEGVKTKVLMEGGENFLGEEWKKKQLKTCKYLEDKGLPVKEDPEGTLTHAKLLIVDDQILIGSTNWNYNALTDNRETNLKLKSRKIKEEYTNYFNQIWKKSFECR